MRVDPDSRLAAILGTDATVGELVPPPGGRPARRRACARSRGRRTGPIEGIEDRRATRLVLGVQWHAETLDRRAAPAAVRGARSPPRGRASGSTSPPRCAASASRSAATGGPTATPWSGWARRWRRAGRTAPGLWIDGGVGMVHRRLAIIDLSERGAQPMRDEALGLTIVFNGCIYNHHELRAELRALGHSFVSLSDTEVLLKGWAEWGEDLPRHLHGMFAFALHEERRGRTVLVRDRLGVKPLYLAEPAARCAPPRRCRRCWRPAGSTPAWTRSRCTTTCSWHSVVPAPRTILRGVHEAPAGDAARDRARRRAAARRLLGPAVRAPARRRRLAGGDARGAAGRRPAPHGGRRPRRHPAVRRAGLEPDRRAAGPAGPDAAWPRSRSASRTSASARATSSSSPTWSRASSGPTTASCGSAAGGSLDALPEAIEAMSEPMVSHDCVAFWLLSEAVRRERKVVQSGQGADEVLGGYDWYPPLLRRSGLRPRHVRGELLRPRRRRRARAARRRAGRGRLARVRARVVRRARAPTRPSTARCAWTPR